MKVLLVEAPWINYMVDGSRRTLVPLGIGYLVSALEDQGHSCFVLSPLNMRDILQTQIDGFIPDLIGISSTTDAFTNSMEIAKHLRKSYNVPIVLGGVHATIVGGDVILEKWPKVFDFVLEGEGEISLPALAHAIENHLPVNTIAGLCYYQDGVAHRNQYELIHDLDSISFPSREKIRQPEKYKFSPYGLDITIATSRGCNHNCGFCSVCTFYKRSWRYRSVNNIIQEIDNIVSIYGSKFYLHFIDDNFFVNPSRAVNIVKELHNCWPQISFSFATRSDQVIRGSGLLQELADNGVKSIELGIENGSQSILNRYNKGISVEQNLKALQLMSSANIEVAVDYILFDHYTSLNELKQNIHFLKAANLWGYYPPLVYSYLTLYPGTLVAKQWEAKEGRSVSLDKGDSVEFKDATVGKICANLQKLNAYQPQIYEIMDKCRYRECNSEQNIQILRLVSTHLSFLPYKLLEQLCDAAEYDETDMFEKITEQAIAEINRCKQLI